MGRVRYHVLCTDAGGKSTLAACYESVEGAEVYRSFQQAVTAEDVEYHVQQTQVCTCPGSYR